MKHNKLHGKYRQLKGKLAEIWGHIIRDMELVEHGLQEQFHGKMHAKYGITKEQAKARHAKFVEESHSASHHSFQH